MYKGNVNPLPREVVFLVLNKLSKSFVDGSSALYMKEPHTGDISTFLVETYPTICTETTVYSGKDQFNDAKCIQNLI